MKPVEDKSSSKILCQEIEDQSKSEAEAILGQAKKERDERLKKARQEANKLQEERRNKAEAQAESIRKKILSGVHLEIKGYKLRDREEILSRIFMAVQEKLAHLRKSNGYFSFLKKLLMEGIQALDSEKIIIIPGDIERQLLQKGFLDQLQKELQKSGKKIQLSVSDEKLSDGGVILGDSKGRIRFDNRFSSRMKRNEEMMRLKVMEAVYQSKFE